MSLHPCPGIELVRERHPAGPGDRAVITRDRAIYEPMRPSEAEADFSHRYPEFGPDGAFAELRRSEYAAWTKAPRSFAYAHFEHRYPGLQVVASFLTAGILRSPVGLLAGWMTRRQPPDWVSAKPKRFAWTLGLAMAGAMTIITNDGIRGWLPRSTCPTCPALMWLEAALGPCPGCEIHGLLVRRGRARKDEAFQICAHGACDVTPRRSR